MVYATIDHPHITVKKAPTLDNGVSKYSDLYETVQPNLNLRN